MGVSTQIVNSILFPPSQESFSVFLIPKIRTDFVSIAYRLTSLARSQYMAVFSNIFAGVSSQ